MDDTEHKTLTCTIHTCICSGTSCTLILTVFWGLGWRITGRLVAGRLVVRGRGGGAGAAAAVGGQQQPLLHW